MEWGADWQKRGSQRGIAREEEKWNWGCRHNRRKGRKRAMRRTRRDVGYMRVGMSECDISAALLLSRFLNTYMYMLLAARAGWWLGKRRWPRRD
jgi:hypothetical protein